MRLFDWIFKKGKKTVVPTVTIGVESNRNLENVVKEEVPEESDSKIICLYRPGGPTRVICCDWSTMPADVVEQLLESTGYPEGYEIIKGSNIYQKISRDFTDYRCHEGMNNHYEGPGAYIDYTFTPAPELCKWCNIFPWTICEWIGDTSMIPLPKDRMAVKFSKAQKRVH